MNFELTFFQTPTLFFHLNRSDQDAQVVNLAVLARDAQKKEKERF